MVPVLNRCHVLVTALLAGLAFGAAGCQDTAMTGATAANATPRATSSPGADAPGLNASGTNTGSLDAANGGGSGLSSTTAANGGGSTGIGANGGSILGNGILNGGGTGGLGIGSGLTNGNLGNGGGTIGGGNLTITKSSSGNIGEDKGETITVTKINTDGSKMPPQTVHFGSGQNGSQIIPSLCADSGTTQIAVAVNAGNSTTSNSSIQVTPTSTSTVSFDPTTCVLSQFENGGKGDNVAFTCPNSAVQLVH